MKILTNRNGIALVAVLAVLLVLTLLLPAMFTMSERATKDAYRGQDEQRASYLARTMIEMSVAAFQDQYDAAEDEQDDGVDPTDADTVLYKLNYFYNTSKEINANTLYMYHNESVKRPKATDYQTDEYENGEKNPAYKNALYAYEKTSVAYSTLAPDEETGKQSVTIPVIENGIEKEGETTTVEGTFIGKADCKITYDDATEYYKTTYDSGTQNYQTVKVKKSEYDANKDTSSDTVQYSKIEKRNVIFVASAKVNGKGANRRCVVYLPTKPSDQNWIVPAELESNQIFVDSSKATSVTSLKMPDSFFIDESAAQQKMYFFSCIGNMVISSEGMTFKDADGNNIPYDEYVNNYNDGKEEKDKIKNQLSDFSLGVHPITTTRDPEHDPNFACVKTNNMRSWAKSGQKDNFVGFTATQGIQVDMPVNLLINPCRTMRIGDGTDRNQSLYKLLYFQAPTIVFNKSVNSFVSLYQNTGLIALAANYNAYRMSSIVLAAPQSTPYSYYHSTYKKTVTAGMVYFMEDAYVWVVPFTENGSNYKTQTVYYKGKDIILYKFANAGDVYLFNNEVQLENTKKDANGNVMTDGDGNAIMEQYKTGFSITNYFMDVLYNDDTEGGMVGDQNLKWYNVWSRLQEGIYGVVSDYTRDRSYVKEDLKYIGNVKTGGLRSTPVIDDFYVVWDS